MSAWETVKEKGAGAWDFVRKKILSPPIGILKLALWPVTIPLWAIRKTGALGYKYAIRPAIQTVERTTGIAEYALRGADGKGGLRRAFLTSNYKLAAGVGNNLKAFLWYVPLATLSGLFSIPELMVHTPGTMIQSTRDAIKSIPGGFMNVMKSIPDLKPFSTVRATRDALNNLFWKPAVNVAKRWLKPPAKIVQKAAWGYTQYFTDAVPGWYTNTWGGLRDTTVNACKHTHPFQWRLDLEGKWATEKPKGLTAAKDVREAEKQPEKAGKPKKDEKKAGNNSQHAAAHAVS